MGRVITIVSGKGGVGKTSVTANLGIALAEQGLRVLLVDADIAMANLSLLLGMQASPITLHDVLLGESDVRDVIYDGPKGIGFIPSGLSLQSYRRVDPDRLKAVIKEIKEEYDYILLDGPAGIERAVLAAIAASDEVLVLTEPNPPAIADALKIKLVAQRLNARVIGFVLNNVREQRGEVSAEDIMKMLELPVYGKIPFDEEMRKTFLMKKVEPVILRNPRTFAVQAIRGVASKLSGIKLSSEEEASARGRASAPGSEGGFFKGLFSIFSKKPKGEASGKQKATQAKDKQSNNKQNKEEVK